MHKSIKLIFTILTAVLAVSCAKADIDEPVVTPENPDGGGGQLVTLYSTIEQTDGTRVKLSPGEENKYNLVWEKDDSFRVVCKGCTEPGTFTLQGEPSEGKFTGTLPEGTSTDYYAVVNYSDDAVSVNSSTGNLDLTIRQNKSAWASNIPANGIPLVAKVESGGSNFKHIFGLLKVTLSATESFFLKRMTVHDLAGNMLWGKCSVPVKEDGSLDCDNITMTEGDNTITMTLNTPKEIGTTSVAYYLPIPQGALADGFSIVLYEYDETKTADNEVGRAYTFMQKITGTKAMPRAGILGVNAPVTAKPESLDEKGRGYYKSLFVNAGISLDRFEPGHAEDDIPAIAYMGLDNDYEYLNTSNANTQTSVLIENSNDANGVLLYPDGSPRFRLIFNRGGSSVKHGTSLGKVGRDRFKTFFDNGGSYSGVCAGAFLAAQNVPTAVIKEEEGDDADFTFNLIPVAFRHTSLPNGMTDYKGIYTNMEILPAASTIIRSLNGDGKFDELTSSSIADVMHHGGGYLPATQLPYPGLKALMTYQFSETHGSTTEPFPGDKKSATYDDHYYRSDNYEGLDIYGYGTNRVGEYSTWVYKSTSNSHSGRAVCTGSHPEVPGKDSHKQFTGFMFRYAMEGNGDAVVKSGDLILGQTRYMNVTQSSYDDPATNNAGIGDGQYHHFKFTSGGIDNFVLRLDSQYDKTSGIDLYLGLRQQKSEDGKKDLAWLSEADYTLCNKGGKKEIRIKNLPAGDWYVSVFCATKVTASQDANSCSYSGKTQVLNGVPYSICIAKDGTPKDFYPSVFGGGDGDDFTDSMDD